MDIPQTWLDDLRQDTQNLDLMHVCVGIDECFKTTFVKFTVSLSYMGLRWEEDFGFEFSKDLQRDMIYFWREQKRIPTSEEYKELTERHLYPFFDVA